MVAPHAGAWIETTVITRLFLAVSLVAPHAGAWIETKAPQSVFEVITSHPMRVRGLKLRNKAVIVQVELSHPMRVRGLKLWVALEEDQEVLVAPHAGAWIETLSMT